MIKKMSKEDYQKFWKEYSTNMKLGVIEDPSNKTRLAKLLRCVCVCECGGGGGGGSPNLLGESVEVHLGSVWLVFVSSGNHTPGNR